jgi:hypothetical protein
MMAPGIVLAATALVGVLSGFAFRFLRQDAVMETVELRFSPDLGENAVWGMLGGISGLPTKSQVVLEVVGDGDEGIRHFLRAEKATIDMLRSHMRGLLPGVRLEPAASDEAGTLWKKAARVRWSGFHPLLRTDRSPETAAALLGALSGLNGGERVMVRWTLRPARGPYLTERQSRTRPRSSDLPARLLGEQRVPAAHLPALRQKYSGPVLHAQAVVAVAAASDGRSVNLLTRVVAVLRGQSGLRGHPLIRYARGNQIERFVGRGPLTKGSRFAPAELMGVIAWPLDGPRVPGLALGVAPQLLPSARIPRSGGHMLAHANWPGMEERRLIQPLVGALSHTIVAAPTGAGKSALLASLIAQDMASGRGCLVLDGKGDLANEVLAQVPASRRADVIVLDPTRHGPVPGMRVFGSGDPEFSGDLILGSLRSIFIDSWGVRSDKWLRAGLVTLAQDPTATLADLPFLFSSESFRRKLTGRLRDPLLRATWEQFEALSHEGRAVQLGSPLNKINELIGRRIVRAVLAQDKPKWDLREAIDQGRVVIVSLSPGVIGAPASRLLAALVIHDLVLAVQGRAQLPPAKRRPFFVYVDEPKVFADVNVPIDSLFELARGNGVGVTIAAQSLAQSLPDDLARAALTNAATLIAFRQNADDGKLLARELPGVSAEELQALGQFEIAARIGLGPGDVSPPVTGRTLPPPEPVSDPEEVRRESAARYGMEPDEVDARLLARHGLNEQDVVRAAQETPLKRRKRRAS